VRKTTVTIGRAIPLTWEQATVTATAEGMRFTIPVITSANRIWRTGQGRTYKSKGASADELQARNGVRHRDDSVQRRR